MQADSATLPTSASFCGQPFALQIHDPKRGLRVAASNPMARHAAIMPGISHSEATALLPSLLILPYDPQADLLALQELTDSMTEFSPLVGIESVDKEPWVGRHLAEPQAIFADVTRLTHFFGGPTQMASTVADWLLQKNLLPVVSIAPSLGAAWAAANYGHNRESLTKAFYEFYADNTTTNNGPSASPENNPEPSRPIQTIHTKAIDYLNKITPIVWLEADWKKHLERLDIAALRINAQTFKTLRRLGIRTVGALQKLPRSGVAPRLGKPLLERLDSMHGDYDEPIICHHAGPEFHVDMTLEVPTNRRDSIEELIRRLSIQLCERLQKHGQGALRVLCRLNTIELSVLNLKLGLYRPTAEAVHLQRLLLDQFERQIRKQVTVCAISMQADIVNALRWQQTSLFEQAEANLQNKTAELIDVLVSRLGNEAVVQPFVRADHLPEKNCEFKPMTSLPVLKPGQPATNKNSSQKLNSTNGAGIQPSVEEPLRRPLSLLQQPQRLEVVSLFPNGPPTQFRWLGKLEHVVRHWGPERIETHWWSGPSQRRDYYRVETVTGAWYWLYRDLRANDWFMHGEFS